MTVRRVFFKSYGFSVALLACVLSGFILGVHFPSLAFKLKFLGDIFLNLLFTAVVPLVFFSISSSVSGMPDGRRLGRILWIMILVFTITGIISSMLMIGAVRIFPPSWTAELPLSDAFNGSSGGLKNIASAFTVPDFAELLVRRNMLALILFSLLIGISTMSLGEKAKIFSDFLKAGSEVMMKLISYVMLYAPIGLFAYFACLSATYGREIMGSYLHSIAVYYPVSLGYFFAGFSVYAWMAGGRRGIQSYWRHIPPASLTALGTGSSIATIPVNLQSADRIGIPRSISEIVLPIGATIHMDGSCLSAILKISLLFQFYGMNFSGIGVWAGAIGVAVLSAMVMSGIPGGGFLGEMMIVTLYGFPAESLPLISMVGALVDPPATMVNSSGDTVAAMLVAKFAVKKRRDKE